MCRFVGGVGDLSGVGSLNFGIGKKTGWVHKVFSWVAWVHKMFACGVPFIFII